MSDLRVCECGGTEFYPSQPYLCKACVRLRLDTSIGPTPYPCVRVGDELVPVPQECPQCRRIQLCNKRSDKGVCNDCLGVNRASSEVQRVAEQQGYRCFYSGDVLDGSVRLVNGRAVSRRGERMVAHCSEETFLRERAKWEKIYFSGKNLADLDREGARL